MAKKTPKKSIERDLIRIATFILFDAAVFHDALTGTVAGLKPLRTAKPPYSQFFSSQWAAILAINYTPVFEIATDVLDSLPASPQTEHILKSIIDAALDVVSSGILRRHDFMGRVYHRLLLRTTGQYYATYYTSIPSAWLLANLVFKSDNPSWDVDFSSLDDLRKFSVIDCACGSGTLLSASYMALKDRYVLAGPESPDPSALHKVLVEDVLHGWDVLDYAAHLTLTSLALHSTKTSIGQSNIYVVPAGVDDDGVHLGSLDRLQPHRLFSGKGFKKHAVKKGLKESRDETIPDAEHDVVIMNPPFSRSANPNIKFGYSDASARVQMNKALKKLAADLTHYGYDASAIGNAGLSAYFMFLAARLVKRGGRVAAVLPRSTLSGVAFGQVRTAFLREFQLEYVISNYDPGDSTLGIDPWSFSENTDLGEVMIIARRKETDDEKSGSTRFLGLWRKPRNEVVSLLYSQQVIRKAASLKSDLSRGEYETIEAEGTTAGVLYNVVPNDLAQNWLAPACFASADLNSFLLVARASPLLTKLSSMATGYGYDIRWLKDAFEQVPGPTAHRLVWGHQSSMNSLLLESSHIGYGRPRHGEKSLDIFDRYSSNVLIAERPHLSTECALAFRSDQPVMGTAFWEIRLSDSDYSSILVAWLASTFGFVLYLGTATSSKGDIIKLKKEQLRDLLVPNAGHIDMHAWQEFLDKIGHLTLPPYRVQFEEAARGQGLRHEIDLFVSKSLGLAMPTSTQYELLARDPIISKKRL